MSDVFPNDVVFILGKTSKHKVEKVLKKMEEKNASVLILTALDEIACKYMIIIQVLGIKKKEKEVEE